MYITDLRHFLDPRGAIGPTKGAARDGSIPDRPGRPCVKRRGRSPAAPKCFKCKKDEVEASVARDNAIFWICPNCGIEGRISNWQGTLWDLRDRPGSR
ncbi:hypothetical protein J7E70_25625 [Variovorax paradoxus]|nr:hypothetical protein [Variovorax paradoxus]MBT2303829.1 hypothetical protein [Variovorax paradoxus]